MEQARRSKAKTVRSIVEWTLIAILLAFDIFVISMRFSSSSNGATNFFGNQIYIVQTGSMEGSEQFYKEHPEYKIQAAPVNSAVFVNLAPELIAESDTQETITRKQKAIDEYYGAIQIGDVMTFYYQIGKTVIVTHRVIAITVANGQYGNVYKFTLRGDNPSGDKVVTPYAPTQEVNSSTGMVIGKVTGVNPGLGGFIVNVVQNKVLMGVLIIAPAAAIFIYEIVKIALLVSAQKRGNLAGDSSEEIAALKEEIAALKGKNDGDESSDDLTKLRSYKTMLDEGLISEEEYNAKKCELLDKSE